MQKWHDEGYFSADLLMKRTHLETEWLPVGELARRSGGDKIFLSPMLAAVVPPGLSRRVDTTHQGFPPPVDQPTYNGPYHPAPVRTLRASTLDSYLGSNSNPSDSPSSSFGAGGFGNGSPDPAAFSDPVVNNKYLGTDSSIGIRAAVEFSAHSDPSIGFGTMKRNTSHDPLVDPSLNIRSSYGNIPPGRGDSYGFSSSHNPSQQQPWSVSSAGTPGPGIDGLISHRNTVEPNQLLSNFGPSSNASISLPQQVAFGNNHSTLEPAVIGNNSGVPHGSEYEQRDPSLLARSTSDMETMSGFHNYADGYNNKNQIHSFAPSSLQYSPSQSLPLANHLGQHEPFSIIAPSANQPPANLSLPQSSISSINAQLPWNSQEPVSPRRPGPFEAIHPTSANTIVNNPVTASQPAPWTRQNHAPVPVPLTDEPSPWFVASQGVVDESWKEVPGPNSLTFHNVGQHNQLPQELAPHVDSITIQEASDLSSRLPSAPSPPVSSIPAPSPTRRRKSANQSNQTQAPASKPAAAIANVKSPSPPPAAQPKPAWSNDDENKKALPAGISLNIREIQDAEVKKLEVRKAAEKERERAARAAAPISSPNDPPTFTASWGLPTSRVGAARNAPQKETQVNAPAQPVPVWTSVGKVQPTKKTMKEIQEEEQRRKKYAAKEPVVAVARRAVDGNTKASFMVSFS
jgi:PERQ amino acid-rich with GYF domain-containing protein